MQRPNRFDLDQKIKINSKNIFRGVESFKSSKNKLFRCRNDGKLTITQLFLTKLLLMWYICHNYTTIYGSLYAIYGRWPNLSGHVKKTPSILHQSKNPLEEWFLSAKGAFLLKDFLISFFLADQFLCTKVAATKWSAPYISLMYAGVNIRQEHDSTVWVCLESSKRGIRRRLTGGLHFGSVSLYRIFSLGLTEV